MLAEAPTTVMVFETGLPTRYYLDRPSLKTEVLKRSDTETACRYKGTTSGYWSAVTPRGVTKDVAWVYDFPTRQLLPIAGLAAFYNEKGISSWRRFGWSGRRRISSDNPDNGTPTEPVKGLIRTLS